MTKEERERQRRERLEQEEAARRAAEGKATRAKSSAKTPSSKEPTGSTDEDLDRAAKTLIPDDWAGGNAAKIIEERARAFAKARRAMSTPEKDPKALKDELIKKLNSLGRKGLTPTTQTNIATALGMPTPTYTADYDGFYADMMVALRDPNAVAAKIEAALAVLK